MGDGESRPGPGRRPGYSRMICLICAIASSTTCSGLMPSATMRWTAVLRSKKNSPSCSARAACFRSRP